MELFHVSDAISINLDAVQALLSVDKNTTRVYLNMGKDSDTLDIPLPIQTLRSMLTLRMKGVSDRQNKLQAAMDQLTKYQTVSVP